MNRSIATGRKEIEYCIGKEYAEEGHFYYNVFQITCDLVIHDPWWTNTTERIPTSTPLRAKRQADTTFGAVMSFRKYRFLYEYFYADIDPIRRHAPNNIPIAESHATGLCVLDHSNFISFYLIFG